MNFPNFVTECIYTLSTLTSNSRVDVQTIKRCYRGTILYVFDTLCIYTHPTEKQIQNSCERVGV